MLNAADALGTIRENRRTVDGVVVITREKGEGGTQGFLEWLGLYHPVAFAAMLGKVLPIQVNMKRSSSNQHTVEIKYPSLEEARKALRDRGFDPKVIEEAAKPKFITHQ